MINVAINDFVKIIKVCLSITKILVFNAVFNKKKKLTYAEIEVASASPI